MSLFLENGRIEIMSTEVEKWSDPTFYHDGLRKTVRSLGLPTRRPLSVTWADYELGWTNIPCCSITWSHLSALSVLSPVWLHYDSQLHVSDCFLTQKNWGMKKLHGVLFIS
jgi:hypothetical protein